KWLPLTSTSTGTSEAGVFLWVALMNRAQNRGTIVIATAYDAKSAKTTASANAENKNWLTPYKNVTGKKTIAVVREAANTGRATSRPPFSAATAGFSPNSRWR